MNALQSKYGSQDFVVLGFPCNQFHYQEPGTEAEILQGVKHVRPGGGFVPNFQLFAKIEVNGANEIPLYTYLKNNCPATAVSFNPAVLMYTPIKSSDVQWNWETFLINKAGKVVSRAAPALDPLAWEASIQAELAKDVHGNSGVVG
jgi:glutathione peroxidase